MTFQLKKYVQVFGLLLSAGLFGCLGVLPVVAAPQDKPELTDEQKKLVNAVNDQAQSAQQSIELAEQARRSADSKVTLISDRSSFEEADEIALRKVEELAEAVRSVTTLSVVPGLDNTKTQLEKVKTDLTTARDGLPAEAEGLPEEIGVARKKANDGIGRLEKQIKAQADSKKKLQDALGAVPLKIKALAELFPQRLTEISAISEDAGPETLIPALPENIATLLEVEAQRRVLRDRWKELSSALAQAESENAENNAAVVTAIDALDTQVVNVVKNLEPWMITLAGHAKAQRDASGQILPKLIEDPVMNSPEAMTLVNNASDLHAELSRVIDAWTKLEAQLQGITISGFDLAKASQAAHALTDADRNLNTAIAVLQDALTGDASKFVADQVSLYYFTDVPRIMKMLNSATYTVGGVKGAQERAALERQKLMTTELDLTEAQSQVNTAQQRVITLQEELRQSKASFASATEVLRKASRSLKGVQDDHAKNDERFNKAKAEFDATPTDPEKRLAFDRASEEKDRSAARLLGYEQRNEDATRERDSAKERNDVLADEQAGLPTKIQQAKDQLENAQSAVVRQRRAAFVAAQSESEAFAMARDNTPFWFAPAIASACDPV
jgi:chromosome segregation ATPase